MPKIDLIFPSKKEAGWASICRNLNTLLAMDINNLLAWWLMRLWKYSIHPFHVMIPCPFCCPFIPVDFPFLSFKKSPFSLAESCIAWNHPVKSHLISLARGCFPSFHMKVVQCRTDVTRRSSPATDWTSEKSHCDCIPSGWFSCRSCRREFFLNAGLSANRQEFYWLRSWRLA